MELDQAEVVGTVHVDYATGGGTATAGSDYTSTSGTLTFDSGTGPSLTVNVPILDDNLVEADETLGTHPDPGAHRWIRRTESD